MSKYNLIDILEQYQIGSGWTNDFDYDGMLQAGLKTGVDTDIETLKKIVEDFTDVNYHREASHLYDAIEALEKGDAFEAEGRLSDFHAEIKKTMEDQGMDTSDDLGAFMASKMEENTEAVDLAIEASQEKAGIKEEKLEEMTGEIYRRIDGMIDQNLKAEFIDKFISIQEDFIESGEEFDALDVIDYLASEMQKYTAKSFMGEDSIEEALPKFKGVPPMKDIVKALKDDAKATDSEIKQFMASLKQSGDEFDDVDDYVEDFKNYVADKSLQEHFGRFMKDYQ